MLLGAGLLVSALPFLILLSAFASNRVDDDIAPRLGLDRRASGIVTHLLTSSPATLNVATATSRSLSPSAPSRWPARSSRSTRRSSASSAAGCASCTGC
jgi:hypothetical protein